MKVILKQDVDNLGDAGEIVDVADGYGNNYLVPRGLAMRATKGALQDAQAIARARHKQAARTLADAERQQQLLQERPVIVGANAGEDGTLYGSVGNARIAEAIREQLGVGVDRRRLPLEHPLKTLGVHEVGVRLHAEVQATVQVEIVRAT
ncbi:MAG: 50S ribosomal protein L9 [Egibacteraceae bacterium]